MFQPIAGEIWKKVSLDFSYTNDIVIEVSDHGRVRSVSPKKGYSELKGSKINGYQAVKIKFFKPRKPADQLLLDELRAQMATCIRESGKLERRNRNKKIKDASYFQVEETYHEYQLKLQSLKKQYQKIYRKIELKRTINYTGLVHRMIAGCFLKKPSIKHLFVAHLDHDKLNNRAENLAWMTQTENTAHQKKSPAVIKAKKERFGKRFENSKVCKLTSTKVMLIKKKLNEGMTQRNLAKTFKVSEMQISRIKRGENWANIAAAK